MIVDTEGLDSLTRELSKMLESIPKQQDRLEKELKLCNLELSDIDHHIELANFNASEGYKMSKDRKITLIRRREIKNEIFSLGRVLQHSQENNGKNLGVQVNTLVRSLNTLEDNRKNRKYTPRVRKDLTDVFKDLKDKELSE